VLRVIATTALEQPVAAFCGALLIRLSQVFRAVYWRGYMPGAEAYCTASSACTLTKICIISDTISVDRKKGFKDDRTGI
jgi:hypothetical protein